MLLISFIMETKQKWSDLINRVQRASQQQRNFINFQQRHRMQVLRSQLLGQIGYKKQFQKQQDMKKHKQREEIENLIQRQRQKQIQQKQEKKQLELMYQTKNHDLMHSPKKIDEGDKSPSAFDKIIQDNINRQLQLKDKFKMQNKINKIQAELKIKNKKNTLEEQKQKSEKFINHVEQQYAKRIKQREKLKEKYFKNGFGEQVQLNPLKNYYKQRQQQIDQTMQHINSKVENSLNSPAYLGKSALSFDRKVQLSFIDKQLGLDNEAYQSKMRVRSQAKQSQILQNNFEKLPILSRNSYKKLNTQNPQSKINKLTAHYALNGYQNKGPSKFQLRKQQININRNKAETPKHAYIQYNIINGTTRQFFA